MVVSMKLLLVLGLCTVADLTSALPLAAQPAQANPAAILSRFLGSGARLRVRAPCMDDACKHGDAGHISPTTTSSVWTPPPTPVHTPAAEVNVVNMCYPNFEGNPVRVKASDGDATWCIPAMPGSLPAPDAKLEALNGSTTSFRIEYTGFDDMTYLIKLNGIGNNSLILAASSDSVGLCEVQGINNPSFKIECRSCCEPGQGTSNGTVASSCTIMDSQSGMYLSSGGNGSITMQASSGAAAPSSSQLFDFVSAQQPAFRIAPVEENEDALEHDEENPCEVDGPCAKKVKTRPAEPAHVPACKRGEADCPYANANKEEEA